MSKNNVMVDTIVKILKSVLSVTLEFANKIILDGLCHFEGECAYIHYRRSNLQGMDNEHVQNNVKILKADAYTLKNTLKLLISIREESELMPKYIKDIKREIHLLTAINKELAARLREGFKN